MKRLLGLVAALLLVAAPTAFAQGTLAGSAHDFSGAAFIAETLADPRIYAALDVPRN